TANGEIIGAVSDSTGAALPGVKLTLTHQGSNEERILTSDNNGNFVAPALAPGEYTIKGELPNFKTQIRRGVTLQVGRQERVDLVMEVGDVAEEVTVEESAPLL